IRWYSTTGIRPSSFGGRSVVGPESGARVAAPASVGTSVTLVATLSSGGTSAVTTCSVSGEPGGGPSVPPPHAARSTSAARRLRIPILLKYSNLGPNENSTAAGIQGPGRNGRPEPPVSDQATDPGRPRPRG